ncbi:sulfite exporter TauE/SafE family protein [Cytophagaceae bacterium ABcell3]|nr:sulfite exporter TauE/SafE family protein [Cytophagaceae bacterium ABcell3]
MINGLILIFGAFLIFVLSTLTGGGASLLLMPLIAFAVGVRSVAPIMTIGIAMSSSSKVFFFWKYIDWKLFSWLFPSTIAGSVLGANMLAIVPVDFLQIVIGLFLVSTIYQLRDKGTAGGKKKFKVWYFVPIGFIIAFLSGLIGGVGPLMNSAYLSYGISKEGLIGTRAANAVILHVSKIISYTWLGLITEEVLVYGLLTGSSAVLAIYIGKLILARISYAHFRVMVVGLMVLSGLIMLWSHRNIILDFLTIFSL